MANGDSSKFPTFQWVAGILLTILLIVAGASLSETRSDVKDNMKDIAAVCDRATKLEAKFTYIVEGIAELKKGQKEAVDAALRVKTWNSPELQKGRD